MVNAQSPLLVLWHGTTMRRAEAIVLNGPDPDYRETVESTPAEGFFGARASGPYPCGSPQDYAMLKAKLFPEEGGPAIVEMAIPVPIALLADQSGGDYRFLQDYGIEDLLAAWPTIRKRIIS